jgi:hypothetical protein
MLRGVSRRVTTVWGWDWIWDWGWGASGRAGLAVCATAPQEQATAKKAPNAARRGPTNLVSAVNLTRN